MEINIAYEGIKEFVKEGYGVVTNGFGSPYKEITINRSVAVNYALSHCGDDEARPVNPDFYFFEYDCTNFVAQCWNAAGLAESYEFFCDGENINTPYERVNKVANFITEKINSYNWINVDGFYNYVTTHNIARVVYSSVGIQPGDIIQFRYIQPNGTQVWMHSAIITGFDDEGGLCYTGHSTRDDPRYNKPLSLIYPPPKTTITEVRFLVPLHPTYY